MAIISFDGRSLWHSDRGSGPPMLFIHGGGSDGAAWAEDLAPVANGRRVITFNRRGYADSGPPADDWGVHARDAAALINSLNVGPVVVVGYSVGSVAAIELAVTEPALVSRLVLLDPAFRVRSHSTPGMVRAFVTAQLLRRVGRPRRGMAVWHRYVMSYRTGGSAYDHLPVARRERLQANAHAVFADFATGDGSHIDAAAIRDLRVPTTLISAELSPPFLRKSSAWLARNLPDPDRVTLQGAGHAVAHDRPAELLSHLRNATATDRRRDAPSHA